MKKTLLAVALIAGVAHSGFAFIAVTGADGESNAKGPGNSAPGAQVGDTFTVDDGTFVTYLPGYNDPTITKNDLGNYAYILNGTVASVSGNMVDYTGTYEIYYDATASQSVNEADYAFSSGTFTLGVDFNGTGPVYTADGILTQTSGPSPSFTSQGYDGFAEDQADFIGTYTQSDPAGGFVQGTLSSVSVPDSSSTLLLATPCLAGLAFLRRKLA